MRRSYFIAVAIFTVTVFSGCVSNLGLTEESRSSIKNVSIPKSPEEIERPEMPFYISRYSVAVLGTGGALDVLISESIKSLNEDKIERIDTEGWGEDSAPSDIIDFFFSKWGFDVQDRLSEEFDDQFRERNLFPVSEDSSHQLRLKIESYGYQVTTKLTLADTVLPTITIVGTIVDLDGNTLWEKRVFTGPMGLPDYEDRKLTGYLRDPEYALIGWDKVISQAVSKLLDDLQ